MMTMMMLFRLQNLPLMTSHNYTFFLSTIMSRINEIYGANAEILHVKLGCVYNYTGLNFEAVITVDKSARILSKHVRFSQFFPPLKQIQHSSRNYGRREVHVAVE